MTWCWVPHKLEDSGSFSSPAMFVTAVGLGSVVIFLTFRGIHNFATLSPVAPLRCFIGGWLRAIAEEFVHSKRWKKTEANHRQQTKKKGFLSSRNSVSIVSLHTETGCRVGQGRAEGAKQSVAKKKDPTMKAKWPRARAQPKGRKERKNRAAPRTSVLACSVSFSSETHATRLAVYY